MCPYCKAVVVITFPNDLPWDNGDYNCKCGKNFIFENKDLNRLYI